MLLQKRVFSIVSNWPKANNIKCQVYNRAQYQEINLTMSQNVIIFVEYIYKKKVILQKWAKTRLWDICILCNNLKYKALVLKKNGYLPLILLALKSSSSFVYEIVLPNHCQKLIQHHLKIKFG